MIGLCLIVSLFVGLSYWLNVNQPSAVKFFGPVETIRSGIVGEYSTLSIIAQEQGFFKANGLNVTLMDYVSGPPAVADMLAGKVDIVTAADFVGVRNIFDNKELRIIASQGKADSFFLVVRSDHNIKNSNDLKGKRIGITHKTAGEFYLGQYLTLHQLSLNDVTLTDLPPDQLADALVAGSLDAIITFNPHISNAQSQLKSSASVWSLQEAQKLSPLLYCTSALTTKRPEAIKRYLRAMVQAEDFIQTHNVEARHITGNYLKFDDTYMKKIWANISFDVSLDQDLLISMDDQARWAIENELATTKTVPDYLQFIYFKGLESVKPESITIIR